MTAPSFFGALSDGRPVTEFTLANRHGIVVKILDFGGIVRSLLVPDARGKREDVVLGFDTLAAYERKHPYFGAIIGRVAGRISGGRLQLSGDSHQLSANESPNHLHGGDQGFDSKLWEADFCEDSATLTLHRISRDGEEGYPGELSVQVSYRLTERNELIVEYRASTDATTVVNLTQHSYFNLSGNPAQPVGDHELTVQAGEVLELGENGIPTGRFLDVAGTDLDLRSWRNVADYDNYWVIDRESDAVAPTLAAKLWHEASGRTLEVQTTAPGLQVYSGTALPKRIEGKAGVIYGPASGICLETQVHPDSPSQTSFPSIVLSPDMEYTSKTVFRFGAATRQQIDCVVSS